MLMPSINAAGTGISLGIVTASLTMRAGGIHLSTWEPRLELAKRLKVLEVYGTQDSQQRHDLENWKPTKVSVFPVLGPKRFGYAPKLGRALLASEHDILHQHGIWMYPSIAVRAWAKQTGHPTVLSAHGMLDRWALRNNAWKKRLALLVFEEANLRGTMCLHALSRQEADAYRNLGLSNPIAIVPNGVVIPDSTSGIETPEWARNEHRNVLLFLGRIHPKKGLLQLVRAWKLLKQANPRLAAEWVLVIAGWDDGGHEATLTTSIFENDLERDVLFLGPLFGRDKERAMRHARAFILPSFSEGLPMAVLEAWSFELPVFMTKFCNLQQGFEAEAAFEIATDPRAMSASLSSILGDESALRAAGQRGRKLVERCFTWSVVAEQFIALYRWLMGRGSSPTFVQQAQ
jgi:glycosyltransferase involved in cell wall biosynthesis